MQAYRIEWTESEIGWGMRPDGYSLHSSAQAARDYLVAAHNELPKETPEEYSYPSNGWREPAIVVPVEIADDGVLAVELAQDPNLRVFRSFGDTPVGRAYKEARELKITGEPVLISYGEEGYTQAEQEILRVRDEINDSLEQREISPARAIEESRAMIRYLGFKPT